MRTSTVTFDYKILSRKFLQNFTSNLISLIFQKQFQIYGFPITQNVFVHLSCSNKTNSQIYVITHSSRGKFSSLVESVGNHERSAKSTIGFVIGFVYRFQYYKSKFLFSFFLCFQVCYENILGLQICLVFHDTQGFVQPGQLHVQQIFTQVTCFYDVFPLFHVPNE